MIKDTKNYANINTIYSFLDELRMSYAGENLRNNHHKRINKIIEENPKLKEDSELMDLLENFHREHLTEGLEIHMVGQRYLFARNPTVTNFHVDISKYIRDKIKALCEHKAVMKNFFFQQKLIARANDLHIDLLEDEIENETKVKLMVRAVYSQIGKEYGVKFAEIFNRIGAGFLEDLEL